MGQALEGIAFSVVESSVPKDSHGALAPSLAGELSAEPTEGEPFYGHLPDGLPLRPSATSPEIGGGSAQSGYL